MENNIEVTINEDGVAKFNLTDKNIVELDFSKDNEENIINLYNNIFEVMYNENKIINMYVDEKNLENKKNLLYFEVITEYINDLNTEIKASFPKITEIHQIKMEIDETLSTFDY